MLKKRVLTWALMIAVLIGAIMPLSAGVNVVYADGDKYVDGDGAAKVENPYPDVFSSEEIAAEQAKQDGGNWEVAGWMYKIIYTPNVGEKMVFKNVVELNNTPSRNLSYGGTLDVYLMIFGKIKSKITAWNKTGFSLWIAANWLDSGDHGQLVPGNSFLHPSFSWNGNEVVSASEEKEEVGIKFQGISENQFLRWSVKIPKGVDILSSRFGLKGSSGSIWAGTERAVISVTDIPEAHFHFVDDSEFRKVNKFGVNDEIPGRNGNLTGITGKAGLPIEGMKELVPEHVSYSYFEYIPGSSNNYKGTFVRPSGDLPEPNAGPIAYSYYETDPKTGNLLMKDDKPVSRLNFKELTNIVEKDGKYLYTDDDLDWPAASKNQILDGTDPTQNGTDMGNHIIAPGYNDSNTKLLYDRHYYIMFGKAPVPVVIKKIVKNSDPEKTIAGVKFDLYRKGETNDADILILKDLTTDEEGQIKVGTARTEDEIRAIVKARAEYDEEKSVYVHEGETYLTPGEYYLKETKAPSGFEPIQTPIPFSLPRLNMEEGTVQPIVVKVENEPVQPTPVRLVKVDEKNPEKKIPGAKFDLYRVVGDVDSEDTTEDKDLLVKADLVTNENGEIQLGEAKTKEQMNALMDEEKIDREKAMKDGFFITKDGQVYLFEGQYYLVEKEAPAGYKKLDKNFEFTLEAPTYDEQNVAEVVTITISNEKKPKKPDLPIIPPPDTDIPPGIITPEPCPSGSCPPQDEVPKTGETLPSTVPIVMLISLAALLTIGGLELNRRRG